MNLNIYIFNNSVWIDKNEKLKKVFLYTLDLHREVYNMMVSSSLHVNLHQYTHKSKWTLRNTTPLEYMVKQRVCNGQAFIDSD